MYVLNVDLVLKPGAEESLETTFQEVFVPAVSQQEGFSRTELLRPITKGAANYRLVIVFESQSSQRKWLATPLHQQVWPQMEGQCTEYSVQDYTPV